MPKPAISVENLSKAYRIGLKEEIPDTLAGAFTGFLKSPFRNLRQLSRLDTFRHQADDEDIFWALRDVSFEVQEGEVLGVIGRNGAGKSTLLKILSRITEPTSGRAVIRGRVSSLLEVGTGFHPELSGRENVYLNGTILGMTKAEIDRKFDEIVDFSGVEKFLDTPIKRYSSGMKVRLAFAVAAHLEPEILIIDEVLAVGDAEFQKKCLGKMQDVASHGRTVLFVSHDMAAVETLCMRVCVIGAGRIRRLATPATAIREYLSDAQDTSTGHFNLTHSATRKAGISPTITSLTLLAHNIPTSSITSGDPFTIRLTITPNEAITNARVAVAIEDSLGRRILSAATYYSHSPRLDITAPTTIDCMLTPPMLAPGRYMLSASIGTKEAGLIDSIDQCAWFDVGWQHRFHSLESYIKPHGSIVLFSEWQATLSS